MTTVGYGGGVEAGELLLTDEETKSRLAASRVRAARVLRNRPAQSVRQEPIGQFVHARQPRQSCRMQTTSKGFGEYRVIGTYREPKVFGSRRGRLSHRDARAADSIELQFRRGAPSAPSSARRLSRAVSVSGSYQIQRTELFDEHDRSGVPGFPIDRLFPQTAPFVVLEIDRPRYPRRSDTIPRAATSSAPTARLPVAAIGSEVGFAKSYFMAQMFRDGAPHRAESWWRPAPGSAWPADDADHSDTHDGEPTRSGRSRRSRSWSISRRASGSLPAVTRPSVASRSISSASR